MKREIVDRVVEDLKKYPEVVAIVLYGSYAKGKEKPLSDIDIAVILKDQNLEAEVSSFSSNVLDVVPFHRLPLYIKFEVLKHGKVLFLRDREDFTNVKRRILRDYLEMSYLYKRMQRRVLSQ